MVKIEINCFLEEKVRWAYFCYMQKSLGKEEDIWFIEITITCTFTDLV